MLYRRSVKIMDQCSNQEQQDTMYADESLVDRLVERLRNDPQPLAAASQAREINIRPLNYGYIVNIGCQTFAIESVEKLISNLEKYLNSPIETEKKWFSGNLLK